jgi:dipeptidase
MVNNVRSSVWFPENLDDALVQKPTWSTEEYMHKMILGVIPEVEKTYAVVEGVFGIMNEVGVGMGESTCAARFVGKPPRTCYDCEGPLVDISFLQLVALERCETARCAIQMMGDMGTKYGYYAVEQTQDEAGETLTIIDNKEAWMFHILPDRAGYGAIWAAQRVPDDHVSVCANDFVIRGVDTTSSDFMYSDNMFTEAQNAGLWHPKDGDLDFSEVFGAVDKAWSYMGNRRKWRVMDVVAPSLNLPSETDYLGDGLPFSVKVDKLLTAKDIMALNRDFYQGTKYDLSKGVAGGPYGDPRRYDGSIDRPYNHNNLTVAGAISGGFERAISVMRTAYSTVLVSRANSEANSLTRAVVWVAQYAPHMSVFSPIYVAAGPEAVPTPISTGKRDIHAYMYSSCTHILFAYKIINNNNREFVEI